MEHDSVGQCQCVSVGRIDDVVIVASLLVLLVSFVGHRIRAGHDLNVESPMNLHGCGNCSSQCCLSLGTGCRLPIQIKENGWWNSRCGKCVTGIRQLIRQHETLSSWGSEESQQGAYIRVIQGSTR